MFKGLIKGGNTGLTMYKLFKVEPSGEIRRKGYDKDLKKKNCCFFVC